MNLFRSEEHITRWLGGREPGATIPVTKIIELAPRGTPIGLNLTGGRTRATRTRQSSTAWTWSASFGVYPRRLRPADLAQPKARLAGPVVQPHDVKSRERGDRCGARASRRLSWYWPGCSVRMPSAAYVISGGWSVVGRSLHNANRDLILVALRIGLHSSRSEALRSVTQVASIIGRE